MATHVDTLVDVMLPLVDMLTVLHSLISKGSLWLLCMFPQGHLITYFTEQI